MKDAMEQINKIELASFVLHFVHESIDNLPPGGMNYSEYGLAGLSLVLRDAEDVINKATVVVRDAMLDAGKADHHRA